MHGSAKGAGGQIIHGRYSQHREIFGERWDSFYADPSLWRFDTELVQFLLREAELLPRLAAGDTPDWREEAMRLFNAAQSAETEEAGKAAFLALRRHLKAGASRDEAWEQITRNSERRIRAAKDAVATVHQAENSFTRPEVRLILRSILQIIGEELGEKVGARVARRFAVEVLGRVAGGGSSETLALPAGDSGKPD